MNNPEDFIAETCPEALLQDVCKDLRAELVTLRKDAERYRWLRQNAASVGFGGTQWIWDQPGAKRQLDRAIDEAMARLAAVG